MKVIASVATSLDGCMDDCSSVRLRLSSPEDWVQVLALREQCDAILVGAGTVRSDNPSLVIRDREARRRREAAGLSADLLKATISRSLEFDQQARFFTEGAGRKVVFTTTDAVVPRWLDHVAEVVRLESLSPRSVVDALAAMGCRRLMVEGGSRVLREFFAAGVVDTLRLAVAPVTVGQAEAPHFERPANLLLQREYMAGETTVYEYDVARSDEQLLLVAIRESERCIPSPTAYSVGAVVVTAAGEVFTGYSRAHGPHNHAEEEALAGAQAAGAVLEGATIYSSMEPCSSRASKSASCSQLIIDHRFARVVYAIGEPDCFVRCHGRAMLERAGIEVEVIDRLAPLVTAVNGHIIR
ncbi:5-amino-6-(5-phosphoribosylamino)uracil reductase [Bacteroidia bacterium]|nr:5-amino-6-(5-phosphoribosylamino)uracil reductase [Bacteroidia bacterium]